jgi:hypothetical protein
MQGFVKTAGAIYKKIQDGVFDVSNEVEFQSSNQFFGLKIEKSECSTMLFSSLFMQLNYIVNQSTCCATKFAFDVCNNEDFFNVRSFILS